MTIDCPHGWKSVAKLGNLTWEDSRVQIHGGVCNSAGRCGITHCQYHDTSREGTRIYQRALARSHTLEGRREKWEQHSPERVN